MKQWIDARGKQCPIPVIETKKVLREMIEGIVETTVDNEIAVQNLIKMAKQMQFDSSFEKVAEDHYVVQIEVPRKSDEVRQAQKENVSEEKAEDTIATCDLETTKEHAIVVLSNNCMGEGDEALGKVLMKGFIYALTELDQLPKKILLYNGGAKLAVEGSDALEDLKLLESKGVEILTCGTCLNFYGIQEKLAVGSVTNMYVIAESMMAAHQIIKP